MKGTVCIIISDPQSVEWDGGFTTLKPLIDQGTRFFPYKNVLKMLL